MNRQQPPWRGATTPRAFQRNGNSNDATLITAHRYREPSGTAAQADVGGRHAGQPAESQPTVHARAAVMSGTTTVSESAMSRPARNWAEIVEAYRPAVMQKQRRSAQRPRVSVCILANQGERHLQETIESVLAQRSDDLEIVIIDDGNSYGTRDILAALTDERVRVIRDGTTGHLGESSNLAVRLSRGQFVKLLCPGATLHPNCVVAQAKVLEDNHDVALVAARSDHIDRNGDLVRDQPGFARIVGRHSAQRVVKTIARSGGNPVGPIPSALFRRADFQRCGGFRTDLPFSPELDLWIRLLGYGDFIGMPQTLAKHRIGCGSLTPLPSMLIQLAEQIGFTERLADDPSWKVSACDRIVGHVNCGVIHLRLTLDAIQRRRSRRRSADSVGAQVVSRLRYPTTWRPEPPRSTGDY
jgi:hypothetical protein